MSDTKILLVDDHAVVRMGFKMLIEAEPDMTVIAEAESGELGIKAFKEFKPDIVIMDITMPGIGGIEAIDRICAHDKSAKILVLSAHEDDLHANRVLKAGAKGYLTKRSAPSELVEAITKVVSGETFLELEIAKSIALKQVTGEKEPIEFK